MVAESNLLISSERNLHSLVSYELKNPILSQIRICVKSSELEPLAIYKKCKNSFVDALVYPSAILEGIETAALCIWEARPNFSDEGRLLESKYIFSTKSIAFCQIVKLL